ncbi:choice-of-anchor L domain-containing protein [Polyangium sp. y55x31]|uniref:choice-of-anchor L domain-containing protein n=1 Tax=Polyangium sp. y55x31 TaxID=3042688 RepID=UPI002482B827|nr:choice-of-anchor L domain-containing protein [Polyangium sp. y55x31]MDI1477392.1 choice-of-anchor L domain-containing protein [Polyangium sp. y55x31]
MAKNSSISNLVFKNARLAALLAVGSASAWAGCATSSSDTFPGGDGGRGDGASGGQGGTAGQGGIPGQGGAGMGGAGQGGGSACGPGTTLCGDACTVLSFDPANCGACGKACAAGEVCSLGQCGITCLGGTTQCNDACADLQNDPNNCGACGTTCLPGQVCSAGQCGTSCVGATFCNGSCVDLDTDPANCGACGTTCAAGQVCSMGQCAVTCLGGSALCGSSCVDLDTDPAHCGTCGNACPSGQLCAAGMCVSIGECNAPFLQCGQLCVLPATDASNCGTCGNKCPVGASCVDGTCQACDSATTDCDNDGWLASEGDCCDKPGLCGAEPEKVNPGAIEVVGNGIDDNCNTKTDLFDLEDTVSCDDGLASDSSSPTDYAKALGICRTTTENASKPERTWGLLSAKLLRADGSALGDVRAASIRQGFGSISPAVLEGKSAVVLSSGIAADETQTNPGPNGGGGGLNVSTSHTPVSNVLISGGSDFSVKDWFATPNLPLKPANGLPDSPGCNASNTPEAEDSVMLVLRLRAPTNARAFSFNSYFMSAEYPEFVCTSYNDQFIALVDTPSGVPSPTPNPVDKNLMTFTSGNQKWPIGINIAQGTNLFAVCDSQAASPTCWDTSVSATSCSLGSAQLMGTGFESDGDCLVGGGTFWLTTAGNVIPGQIVEIRIALWDVGDSSYDSLAILDGFQWLSAATLPGTGG